MKSKKILLATGGSGGHIFPAIRLASVLIDRGHQVCLAGALHRFENKVKQFKIPYHLVEMQGLSLKYVMRVPSAVIQCWQAYVKAHAILKQSDINIVLGFGGYSSFPFVIASSRLRLPSMLHEQNVMPGRANRLLSGLVDKVAISFPQSRCFFQQNKVVHTGCPSLTPSKKVDTAAVLHQWELEPDVFTLLIAGGSQGSEYINEIVLSLMKTWSHGAVQLIHMTGPRQHAFLQSEYHQMGINAKVIPFIEDMELAYALADVVIARSGAGMVTEAARFRKKTVFVPYPHAQHHQLANAKVLEPLKFIKIIEQENLDKKMLEQMILTLKNDTIIPANIDNEIHAIFRSNPEDLLADALESL